MHTEEIQKFLNANKLPANKHLKISFKKRNPVYGVIVHCKDAVELESKNFWRIVPVANVKEWTKSKDINLSRLFHGSDFSKLTVEEV
ncbi:short-chain dehydrogenase [Aridibaculum aurantiacum]|uniref:short-chain dehydrogenase n=1 Tax=Aridibaculum aurantiacum TaxID=2810307 RepID=UPI001A970BB8|nr:short-chain dehydrogenase [Aridibaculum aurantiacum]